MAELNIDKLTARVEAQSVLLRAIICGLETTPLFEKGHFVRVLETVLAVEREPGLNQGSDALFRAEIQVLLAHYRKACAGAHRGRSQI